MGSYKWSKTKTTHKATLMSEENFFSVNHKKIAKKNLFYKKNDILEEENKKVQKEKGYLS